mgnify:CR=1 FL=1|jgi:AAA15 family ATPase/GTPase
MIKKFTVKNYKGFKDEITLDFSDIKNYQFNTFAVKNKLINYAIVYGKNGSGKSNLGLALFDLIIHLTDKQKDDFQFINYLNGNGTEDYATFIYEFVIDNYEYVYHYQKTSADKLTYEELSINKTKIFSYNFKNHKSDFSGLKAIDAQFLRVSENINISVLRYIAYNANLSDKNPIQKLMRFINNMLWIRSATDGNKYMGFENGTGLLTEDIIKSNKVNELELFLRENGINYKLGVVKNHIGQDVLVALYNYRIYDFMQIASHGTRVLLLYFYWLQKFKKASFVFIDEFDAFFHTFLAEDMLRNLFKKINSQLIITTHNTDLMSNNILRPDCYFIISDGKIRSLPNCTERELREGHNLENLFRKGEFDGKYC